MRVLLQHLETGRYVAGTGGWTYRPGDARDFGEVVPALDYALGHELGDVRALIKFEGSGRDLALPPVHFAK